VEDNEMNREITSDVLSGYGVVIDEAEDGDIAIEKIKEMLNNPAAQRYDSILMDIQMPRVNGYEATKAIRTYEKAKGAKPIPIIAMTANAFEEDKQTAFKAGMDAHLSKPVDTVALVDTLLKMIGSE